MADRHDPERGGAPYLGTMRPASEWHEDLHDCLFWRIPISEPPYVTSPLSSDWLNNYFTHFQEIFTPTREAGAEPAPLFCATCWGNKTIYDRPVAGGPQHVVPRPDCQDEAEQRVPDHA